MTNSPVPNVNPDRLRQLFLDLVAFNSPPGEEREVSRFCAEQLHDAGFVTQYDAAGNLIAQKGGTARDAPRIFFSGHVDTVQPTEGLVVREDAGIFRTGGTTILGADDKAAVAEIIEAVRCLEEAATEHGDLQVILSVKEEVGLQGAHALAPEVIAGGIGFVFDAAGATGAIITAAPSHEMFEAQIRGRAAHAGFAPEQGISAIRIAARGIAAMPLGRIDAETTANVGIIRGGTATNIIPEEVTIRAEARSRDEARLTAQLAAMRRSLEAAAAEEGGACEIKTRRAYSTYCHDEASPPRRIAAAAWRLLGREPSFRPTGGGSDASVFNARGIPAVVLSCGYYGAHTFDEHVSLADMVAGAEWALAIAVAATQPAFAVPR